MMEDDEQVPVDNEADNEQPKTLIKAEKGNIPPISRHVIRYNVFILPRILPISPLFGRKVHKK